MNETTTLRASRADHHDLIHDELVQWACYKFFRCSVSDFFAEQLKVLVHLIILFSTLNWKISSLVYCSLRMNKTICRNYDPTDASCLSNATTLFYELSLYSNRGQPYKRTHDNCSSIITSISLTHIKLTQI